MAIQGKCIHHPGLGATIEVNGKKYCQRCEAGQQQAEKLLSNDIEPRKCFVWYIGGNVWRAIQGTGCAHWVAHEKNITKGAPIHKCLAGCTLKVSDLILGKIKVPLDKVVVGQIYVNPGVTHCGIVSKITKLPGKPDKIEIQHSSSRQKKVAKNDYATYFGGKGTFYK